MPFQRPTLTEIQDRTTADVAGRLGLSALLPRSVLLVLAKVLAGAVHHLYGYLVWIARQVMPDTAEAEHLERWADIWGISRKAAAFAGGSVTLTGSDGVVVPAGTVLQRADGVQYTTDADGTVATGTVTVAVTAVVAGDDGNAAASTALSLVSPISGIDAAATVAAGGITGGTDAETDELLRGRLLTRLRQPPMGGAEHDYVAWALEVAGVTRAWAFEEHLGIGTVGVFFARDDDSDGPLPDAAEVQEVQDYIDVLRPVTAQVTVIAPTLSSVNFTLAIVPDTTEVRQAVSDALQDLLERDGAPGGKILLSRIHEAISTAPGETDHTLTTPSADVQLAAGALPDLGTITWS